MQPRDEWRNNRWSRGNDLEEKSPQNLFHRDLRWPDSFETGGDVGRQKPKEYPRGAYSDTGIGNPFCFEYRRAESAEAGIDDERG